MFQRLLIGLVALLVSAGAVAQIYKWVDEDGIVHYSDQPMEGAERIDLPKDSTAASSAASRPRMRRGNTPDEGDTRSPAFSYGLLSIASPDAEQTLWNIQGALNVTLNLQPSLRSGDRVRVYLNGEPQLVDALQFQLSEVWRGEHTLQAEVLDQAGKLMIRSEPIRFFVQQTSVINN